MPPSAMASASPSFWATMPTAPASTCLRAMAGVLVGLGVHPQADSQGVAGGLELRDVAVEDVEVDAQGGGVQLGVVHAQLLSSLNSSR